ncbi:MAG TPA: hypothetical protein VGB45_10335 [Abditibacterium sp.]
MKTVIYVAVASERPDYRLVKTFIWSDEQNVDSDGNSSNPASQTWTELYIRNRENESEQFDIYPAQQEPLILQVESHIEWLAACVAYFLAIKTKGQISFSSQGRYEAPEALLTKIRDDFDVEAALRRVEGSCYALATLEDPYPWLESPHPWAKKKD